MKDILEVCVIDDERAFSRLLSLDLEINNEFKVVVINSGEEAIAILSEKQFDIVLLDYNLGTMTGIQVLEWMREHGLTVPVIMLTGTGTEEVAVKAMKLGVYDYILKERLELQHLPVVIRGVYERFLYRIEAKRQELQYFEEEKKKAAVQIFQTTVKTIALHVNNAVTNINQRFSSYENGTTTNFDQSATQKIRPVVHELMEQATAIETVINSIVEFSNIVYTNNVTEQNLLDIIKELEVKFQKILGK